MDRGDYRVTYRTREVDHDDERFERARTRIPSALDPYRYPDDREELKRAVASTRTRDARYEDDYPREMPVRQRPLRDDVSESTIKGTQRPGTTKTTYSVTPAGLEKESVISDRVPPTITSSRGERRREEDRYDARSSAPDRINDDRSYRRDDRAYAFERPVVERPRREGGAYVVDTDADHVSVYAGQGLRESDRGFGGFRNDPYNYDSPRSGYSRGPAHKSSEAVYGQREAGRDDPYVSGARQGGGSVRASKTVVEDDYQGRRAPYDAPRSVRRAEEDDFAIVERQSTRDRAPSIKESFRETNYGPPETPRGRGRASTVNQSPPDDYVMVSPPRDSATVMTGRESARTGTSMRSAMVRADSYTAEQRLQRRRSRSINFKDKDCDGHDIGDRWHEEPGTEAAMMGQYLRRYKEDNRDDRYSSRGGRKSDEEVYDYEKRDKIQYAPQRVRSRSRGARRREDDDDRSYVDRTTTKTTKTTYY